MAGLTPEDQAVVDAFFASGGEVTRCARGQSGLDTEYVWDERKNTLVQANPEKPTGWRGKHYNIGRNPKRARRSKEVFERRARVRVLADQGLSGPQIAERLGIKLSLVYNDAAQGAIRLPGNQTREQPELSETRQRVLEAFDGEKTAPEIARELGIDRTTVYQHLKASGLTPPKGHPGKRAETPKSVEAVRECGPKGMTAPEIAAAHGLNVSTVRSAARRCGIVLAKVK